MIKVSDYIVKRLVEYGVRHVFMITGGGAMHLNNSVGKSEGLSYICNHHEQASAIAAEGYARVSGKLGVTVVTSGPGGTNTLTGVIGQWLDSVPALYISGQVKQETTIESCRELGLRQLGDQEINIVDIVRPVTKFAAIISDPMDTRRLLEKALHVATSDRPGPVWLDVPLDVQGAMVDQAQLVGWEPNLKMETPRLTKEVDQVIDLLKKAKRPVIIAGHGIRVAGVQEEFLGLAERLTMPIVSTFSGFDLISSDHRLAMGRIGTIGTRPGNFTLQNADLVLSIGSRNNIRQVSYNWSSFARNAIRVIVDIDPAELSKPTLKPDLAVQADAKSFIRELARGVSETALPNWSDWLDWCTIRKARYPVVQPHHLAITDGVHPYHFIDRLTTLLDERATVVAGNGTACVALFQAGNVKKGQRIFWNSGCASMGYDLPAAIGACVAVGKQDVICLAGDGSLQMNIQELATVVYHQYPIKLFVLNNNGYSSIRQTHDAFFDGHRTGCDPSSGVGFPGITKLAAAYDIPASVISSHDGLDDQINAVLTTQGPVICEVRLVQDYIFEPKLSSEKLADGRIISKPLEDMYPFLERDEFAENTFFLDGKNSSGKD